MNNEHRMIVDYSLGPIVGALISFITIPLITYFISPEEYGRVSMFTLATSLLELILYLGLDQAYVKYYFELDNREVYLNALLPSILFSLFCAAVITVFHKQISFLLFDNESETLLVLMLAFYLPASVIGRFNGMFARISERAVRYSFFTVLNKFLLLICCIIFFRITGKQYKSVIYATTFSQAFASLIMVVINAYNLNLNGVKISQKVIRKLLRYGLPLVPSSIVGWVLNSTDKVMIRSTCGYEQLGLYSAALKIVSVLAIIQSCFVSFWTPIAFRWNKENVPQDKYYKVGQILCFILAMGFVALLFFKELIIKILSPSYQGAETILPFLLLHPIMYTISEVTIVGIYFSGKSFMTIIVSIVSCIINILGNLFLIPRYGALGASIATGISYCVFFWIATIFAGKVWKKTKMTSYVVYTVFFLIVCSANIRIGGATIYIVNAFAIVFVILYNIPLLKYLKDTKGLI